MLNTLLTGTLLTIKLTVISLISGLSLAFIFSYLLNSKIKFLSLVIKGFIWFSRGVPVLVQIFLVYYGAAQFAWCRESVLWLILQHPFYCAAIVLALNSSAYTTILLQNMIDLIPKGELEICQCLQLSYYQKYRYIILPRVFTHFWPSYSNEAIQVLKSTTLASSITLIDLMGATRQVVAQTYNTLDALLWAGILYLVLSFLLINIFYVLNHFFKEKYSHSLNENY